MTGGLDGFRFELRDTQPPATPEQIHALLKAAEKAKKRIICHPDAFERIDDLVRREGYGACFKVISCAWLVDPGQMVILQSETDEEADLRAVLDRMATEYAEKAQRDCEEWLEDERRKAKLREYMMPGYLVAQPPSWNPGIITGI